MTDKNIQMTQRNGTNDGWDNIYPATKDEQIFNTLRTVKSGKDTNGIFTTVTYKRPNGVLHSTSVLSGGTSPQYTTRTVTYYASDGTTVTKTDTFTLSYDTDGDFLSEV